MAIKFADEIVKEIRERGSIEVPKGYFTGEAFEEWLYKGKEKDFLLFFSLKYALIFIGGKITGAILAFTV